MAKSTKKTSELATETPEEPAKKTVSKETKSTNPSKRKTSAKQSSVKAKKETAKESSEKSRKGKKGQLALPITVAVLATLLVCIIGSLITLFSIGILKLDFSAFVEKGEYNLSDQPAPIPLDYPPEDEADDGSKDNPTNDEDSDSSSSSDSKKSIIPNPERRVSVRGRLVTSGDFEFYLPYAFELGSSKNGILTYNLVDDDGWAEVKVYSEKSSLEPEEYLRSISSSLEITNHALKLNNSYWVQAETSNILAYATEMDGKIYAVILTVKLDSNATKSAAQMISSTLHMKRVYRE